MNSRRKEQNEFFQIDLKQSVYHQPDFGNIYARYRKQGVEASGELTAKAVMKKFEDSWQGFK